MTSYTDSPGYSSDVLANRQGMLSQRQREDLSDYVQAQGNLFTWHVIIVGSFALAVTVLIVLVEGNAPAWLDQNMFVLLMMLWLVTAVMTLPYSLHQVMHTYGVLQQYRQNSVDQISGLCLVQPLRPEDERLLVRIVNEEGTSAQFTLTRTRYTHFQHTLQAGRTVHVYYLADVLLAVEAA